MEAVIENQFFRSACQALIKEDQELRDLFLDNEPLYDKQHNGICCLYETTMVYLTFKELLKNKFPLSVSWEHPYPGMPSLKADLGLLKDDQTIDSLVEFKIWTSEDGYEIRKDVEKYNRLNFDCRKYIFVVEYAGGDIVDNKNYLLVQNPEVEIVNMEQTSTFFCDWQTKQREYKSIFMYLLRMKDGVTIGKAVL